MKKSALATVPALEPWELEYNAKENGLKAALAARSGKYQVQLSNVGNPDFRQDCTRPLPDTLCGWARVDSIAAASAICRLYISFYDLGGGNWSGGQITDTQTSLVLGRVSYNGRVWDTNNNEIAI